MSVETPEGRKVLVQDLPQYEQSVQKKRAESAKREQAEYDAAVKEYEKDVKAAEAQYQKDLAAYEKQQAEAAKAQNKYDAEIAKLEAQKQKELADAHHSVWGPGGSRNSSDLKQMENTIIKNYNSAINKQVEQKRIETGYQEFHIAYPGQVIPANVAKTFRESPSFSLVGLYEKKIEGKAAKAEYQRQASAQTAQAISAKSSAEYHGNIPNIGFISSGLGTERGAAVKDLPKAPEGKKAVETRRPLINVKTVETIYGGIQIEANPRAFVASLDRQDVDAAGRPKTIQGKEGTQSIFSFENVSNVQDPSAIALLEFQQQLKTKTAPSATVYKGILEERGLPVTPLASRIIDTYSSKGLFRNYKEPKQAKGRKAIIKQDGKQVFDIETGMGDVNIGRKLGFVYDYNLQRPTEEKPVLFEGSLQYVLSPKVQGPQQPKFEEAVGAVGTIDYALAPEPKQTSFNKSLENQYNKLGELQEITQKKAKSGDPRDILVQLAYAPSEAVRSVIGAGGAIVNLFEQNVDPLTEKTLNLKRTARPAPIIFESDVAGTVVLPYQFEKGRFDVSFEEYAQRQSQFIEKKGLPAYVTGIGFDYAGLKGVPSLVKTGIKSAPKLVTKIASPKRQLLTVKGGITVPSKTWDIAEKVGFRKGVTQPKIKTEFGKVTTQQPIPNPFGKERVIPYNLQKAQRKFTESLQAGKTKAVQVGGKIKTAIQKDFAFPNRSLIEGRNVEIPNITRPAKPEFSKTLESARIGLEMKKASLAKRLSEMENIYRGGIDVPTKPYSKRLESFGIGLRVKRQEFTKGISNVGKKIPELKTPKGIIKIQKGLEKRKKAIIFIGKRTVKGIETRRENIIKSLGKLKPTIKTPYLPQKTSLEIAKFKQKEKLDATLARMRKIAVSEEKPKAIVDIPSKNRLSNLKRALGISEPWDFKSIVKPFQKPNLRKEFVSGIRGSPIGKIKGVTSRKEFARLLTESDTTPIASPLTKAKRNLFPEGSYDLERKILLKDIGKIRRKGIDILERKEKTVKGLRGSFKTPDTELEILKGDLSKIGVKATPKPFTPKYSIKDLPATSPDYNFRKMLKDVGVIRRKASDYISFRKMETGALRGTLKTPDTKFELARQDILKIKSKSERIARLRNVKDLKAPTQTIKPIFPVPRKPTELENILEGFKKEKKTGQPYKQVRIDKYVPKYPKSWEAWRGVGIVTAAGTISALGLGQEKAEALPFASIGKIGARQIESGGQVLLFKESKDFGKVQKPFLVPPTLKERQEEDEDNVLLARRAPRQVLTVLPKVSFEFSTPQRVQESIKMKIIQPAKISVIQSSPQKTRQREKQKTRQISTPKYETVLITRVTPKLRAAQTPKLSSPLAPKAPTKLRAPQRQPLREKPVQVTLLRQTPPRKPPRVIFALPPDKEPEKKKSRKEEKSVLGIYLGNVPETQISGIFKRKEITLGKEKIERTRRGDVRVLLGRKRETRKESKWFEGKKGDMFGFKNESKKRKTKFF